MARKQRNDVDYFPHSVNHGKKMFYLRDKYRNDGYAVWFMLLEQLGKAEYHYLDLKDEVQIMYLSAEFKVSELLLNEIIETLVKFNEFDGELWNSEKILFNEKFIENISDAYKKRKNDCIDKNSLVELLTSKGRLKLSKSNPKPSKSSSKGDGNPQTILKDSKEENSKEDNKPKKHKVFSADVLNCYYSILEFFDELNHPKKDSEVEKWQDTIDKLNRIDGLSFEDIIHLTQKTRQDNFWSKNFLTINKLRTKNKDGIPHWNVFYNQFKTRKNEESTDFISQAASIGRRLHPDA